MIFFLQKGGLYYDFCKRSILLQKLQDGKCKLFKHNDQFREMSHWQSVKIPVRTDCAYPYAIIITCSDSRVIPESIFFSRNW